MSEPAERRAFEQGDTVFLRDDPRTPLWVVEPDPEDLVLDEMGYQVWHPDTQRIIYVTEIDIAGGIRSEPPD